VIQWSHGLCGRRRKVPDQESDPVKAYVVTTGTVFGLLALVHVWRAVEERGTPVKNPWFVLITLVAAALSLWAFRLARSARG
jgi:uncharacterized membrane protein YhhN